MPMEDYRLVFDVLNYDGSKSIEFNEFCLINIDKSNNVQEQIKKKLQKQEDYDRFHQEKEDRFYMMSKKKDNDDY